MKRFILALLVVFTLFAFLGCRRAEKLDYDKNNDSDELITTDNEFYKTDNETYKIDTPYCVLYYSAEWKDIVTVEITGEETYTVAFSTVLDEHKVALFSIVIGKGSDEGYELGTLQTDKGEVSVYLIDKSGEIGFELSDESQLIFDRMCEDVNVIISNLIYKNGLVMMV